jgi:hypothetical protein
MEALKMHKGLFLGKKSGGTEASSAQGGILTLHHSQAGIPDTQGECEAGIPDTQGEGLGYNIFKVRDWDTTYSE